MVIHDHETLWGEFELKLVLAPNSNGNKQTPTEPNQGGSQRMMDASDEESSQSSSEMEVDQQMINQHQERRERQDDQDSDSSNKNQPASSSSSSSTSTSSPSGSGHPVDESMSPKDSTLSQLFGTDLDVDVDDDGGTMRIREVNLKKFTTTFIRQQVHEAFNALDKDTATVGQVVEWIEKHNHLPPKALKPKKKAINKIVDQILLENLSSSEEEAPEAPLTDLFAPLESSSEEESDRESKNQRKKKTKRRQEPKKAAAAVADTKRKPVEKKPQKQKTAAKPKKKKKRDEDEDGDGFISHSESSGSNSSSSSSSEDDPDHDGHETKSKQHVNREVEAAAHHNNSGQYSGDMDHAEEEDQQQLKSKPKKKMKQIADDDDELGGGDEDRTQSMRAVERHEDEEEEEGETEESQKTNEEEDSDVAIPIPISLALFSDPNTTVTALKPKPKPTTASPAGGRVTTKSKSSPAAAEPSSARLNKIAPPSAEDEEDDSQSESEQDVDDDDSDYGSSKKTRKSTPAKKNLSSSSHSSTSSSSSVPSGPLTVDAVSDCQYSHHVYTDDRNNVYSVMLNQTDVSYGVKGHNKYYHIQLLEQNDNQLWAVFNKWGRVGAKGQHSLMRYSTLEEAKKAFKKKFHDKTTNDWSKRSQFHRVKGKYTIMDVVQASGDVNDVFGESDDEKTAPHVTVPSALPQRVQEVMEMICSKAMQEQTMKDMDIDVRKFPLGAISKKQIDEGFFILQQLADAITNHDGLNQMRRDENIVELTNQFYTLIPHDFGMSLPPILSEMKLVKKKIDLLTTLSDISLATAVLRRDRQNDKLKNMHPLDRHYHALSVTIAPLDKDSERYALVTRMVFNTHAPSHNSYALSVLDVLQVDRRCEKARYSPFRALPNRCLLWHGSRLTNFVGILSTGLRIAPPAAPKTGYMFGKGLYFADSVSKSANYCHATKENPYGLLVLCEVALGNMYECHHAEYLTRPPVPHHCTKGCGKLVPDPSKVVTMYGGGWRGHTLRAGRGHGPNQQQRDGSDSVVSAFCGDLVGYESAETAGSDLMYNEYIVYDTAQVLIRYVVRVKFDFTK